LEMKPLHLPRNVGSGNLKWNGIIFFSEIFFCLQLLK
jgi:hypothetical protein